MSFPGDYELDRENEKEATICSIWRMLLSSMKTRHAFKENVVNYQEKWTTIGKNIQYLRKLVMLKVFYNDLEENKVSKDPFDSLCLKCTSYQFNNIYCPDLGILSMERASSCI